MNTLNTQRLRLTPLGEGDEDLFTELISDAELMQMIGPAITKVDANKSFSLTLNKLNRHNPLCYFWKISSIVDSCEIGIMTLTVTADPNVTEIGAILKSNVHGNGFAPEAMEAVCDYGLNICKYDAIVGRFKPEHIASLRITRKTGFDKPRVSLSVPGMLECFRYRTANYNDSGT